MPIHDWECPNCGRQDLDVYQSRLETTMVCKPCGVEMERLWTLSAGGRFKFEEFDMHVPGQGTVHFSSMHQLRAVEKHCETHGPRPFVVRQYSQDISNRNDNVFGERHNPTFSPRSSRTGIPFRQQIKVKE